MPPRRTTLTNNKKAKGKSKAWRGGSGKRIKKVFTTITKKTKKTAKRPRKNSPQSYDTEVTEYSEKTEDVSISDSPSDSASLQDSQSDATDMTEASGLPSESHSSDAMGDSGEESDEINRDETLPVHVGSTFCKGRYKAHRKLGFGAFSTVWLAWDNAENRFVALKIQNSSKDCKQAATEEIKILKEVAAGDKSGDKSVVNLLDHFEHKGPTGRHICMVFEYLGDNLLTLIKANKYKGLPLDLVKKLAKQILTGLNYLHKDLKVIHTDLKPENVLLMSPLDPSKDPRPPAPTATGTTSKANVIRGEDLSPRLNTNCSPSPAVKPDENLELRDNQGDSGKGNDPTSPGKGRGNNTLDIANEEVRKHRDNQLISEPSLDRLAIDSDPDIAREAYDECTSKQRRSTRQSNQVTFNIPKAGGQIKQGGAGSAGTKDMNNIDVRCKIVDLGTACWTHKHFTEDIQTRPYRCPEVLLGAKYSTSADMWSFACLVFELATGNILFNPRTGGSEFNRDEDHLAQIMQVLGPIPKKLVAKGTHSQDYLTKNGGLRRLKTQGHCPLNKMLVESYKFHENDAKELTDFLTPLLDLSPEKRPTAEQCLQHSWLNQSGL